MNEQKKNPYATSITSVETKAKGNSTSSDKFLNFLKYFSVFKGRMSRLRYICYSLSIFSLALIITYLLASVSSIANMLAAPIIFAAYILILLISIQRCHDIKVPSWLGILLLIALPLLSSLLLFFIPGTKSENDYGKVPLENTRVIKVTAILLLILYLLCIIGLAIFIIVGSV